MKKLILSVLTILMVLSSANAVEAKARKNSKKAPKKEIAIQLYSARDLINEKGKYCNKMPDLLQSLSDMGYTSIEAAGYHDGKFYGKTPEKFREYVEATGMKVLSSHTTRQLSAEELASGDFSESLKWWDQCISAHKAAGMEYIVTPWMDKPKTLKDLNTYCQYYNTIGERCTAQGLKYGYHNHAHELEKVEDKVMLDYMLENTDPAKVFFQMDVYWMMMGRACAVDYFAKYPGRFTLLHLKDRREIGQSGMVGFDAIMRNAEKGGVKGLIVEVENYSYDVEKSVKISIDYLLDAPFVKGCYSK